MLACNVQNGKTVGMGWNAKGLKSAQKCNAMLFQRIYVFEINDIVLLGTKVFFPRLHFSLAYISISSWSPESVSERVWTKKKMRRGGDERRARVNEIEYVCIFKVAYHCAFTCFCCIQCTVASCFLFASASYYDKCNMFCVNNTQCFSLTEYCTDFCKCKQTRTIKQNEPKEIMKTSKKKTKHTNVEERRKKLW